MEDNVLDQPAAQEGEYNFDEKVGQLLANGYEFKLGEYISAAHRVVMKEMGSFIGFLLLLIVIYGVLAFIPFVGSIANFIISYPLIMGFAIFARRIFYNKPVLNGGAVCLQQQVCKRCSCIAVIKFCMEFLKCKPAFFIQCQLVNISLEHSRSEA